MKVNTQENLVTAIETIKSITINNKADFLGGEKFTRELLITVSGRDYSVVWYKNISTLKSEWCEIPFTDITTVKPTWPLMADSKLTLQLSNNGTTCAII